MNIPFNMEFTFDKNLWEVPVSQTEMEQGVQFLKKQLAGLATSEAEQASIYGLVGVYSRILRKFEESKSNLQVAIELNRKANNKKGLFVNELRLAHTYQWEGNFHQANKLFTKLIDEAEKSDILEVYLDFIYQHQGRNLFDQKNYWMAEDFFKKALHIRNTKGNEELLISTRHALSVCAERANSGDPLNNDSTSLGRKE
ncbi:tetratricopeptide repeat protein [Neobacillus sp. YIM B06451]|uniref:tetratricopeptide repeat protein n=1 Tax=Neobacillus sp. YIM B06451 TaxID=3070994 RepID=UPI00292E5963|nr:tetratricopeptide repeat protein [Neobacillus sp. YIM B06451]